jgi:hypothetical protein
MTSILLKCIDDSIDSQFRVADAAEVAKYVDNTPNLSARSYAILCVNKKMSLDEQAGKEMNGIKRQRDAYNSLFLANFRESSRKRLHFALAFDICNYVLGRVGGESAIMKERHKRVIQISNFIVLYIL